jgi:5-(carboxyamino)imidazole ribonucleotide synthase
LPPGAVIGILGGGQLGRMLSVAASRLGYRCHIYEPGAAPAGDVAHAVTTAPYDDEAALRAFAASVDVITYEFENVPTGAGPAGGPAPDPPEPPRAGGQPGPGQRKGFLNDLGLPPRPGPR